jgi:hypothetical protein
VKNLRTRWRTVAEAENYGRGLRRRKVKSPTRKTDVWGTWPPVPICSVRERRLYLKLFEVLSARPPSVSDQNLDLGRP